MREELRVALQELDKGAQLLVRLGGLNYMSLPTGDILRVSRNAMADLKHHGWIAVDSIHSTPFHRTYHLTDQGRQQARGHQAPPAPRAAESAVS